MAAGGEILTSSATTNDEFLDVVIDTNSQTEYTRGKFLGKGGSAQCYQFVDKKANVVYAGKIVSKSHVKSEMHRQYSLEELHKCRETLTEPEVRHLLRQLLLACEYLVQEQVIHRDLKLGNLLLTKGSQLKVADFGLATRVHYLGQLKRSVCGTTKYMAAEMLTQKGYSYEAHIWAFGCIMRVSPDDCAELRHFH
ncbi:serine/threonine-protein kinase PLK1-like [Amblyomma americanum]